MSKSDLKKIKEIAKRLQVRESDVFRFAVRSSLAKLMPLHDEAVSGTDLVPVFIEYGNELTTFFDLDAAKLDSIINAGVEDPEKVVEKTDLDLLAMSGLQENYLYIRLKELVNQARDSKSASSMLRQYLLTKYVDGIDDEPLAKSTADRTGSYLPSA
jgi:hypothetical protein